MTTEDDERIAAFLAAKGVTQVDTGTAYGIDPEADKAAAKARAKAKRDRRASEDDEYIDEEYRERVNDAYMSGGRAARDEEISYGKNYNMRSADRRYEDGLLSRRVNLNRITFGKGK